MRIAPLQELTKDDVRRIITGYESKQAYDVKKQESPDRTEIVLELVDLPEPFVKTWDMTRMTDWYRDLLTDGLSFGAFDGDRLVGVAIAQRQAWNGTAMVWELHLDPEHRGSGTGRRLLAHVEAAAAAQGLTKVVCETQTKNVPAIGFYRACGYSIEGVDLTYYANDDANRDEVALFVKKPVVP